MCVSVCLVVLSTLFINNVAECYPDETHIGFMQDHSTRQHAYEYILSVLRQGKTSAGTPSNSGGGGGGGESLPENQIPDKDTSSTSWTRSQTLLILEQYKANVDEFINPLLKKQLWEELCKSLNSKGYHFNSKQVKGRLKTIVAAYRRAKDSNRATGAKRTSFEFKAQLDYILGEKHDTSPAFTISNLESASSSSACTGDSEEDTDSGEEPNVKNTVEPTRKRKSSLNQILKILKQYGEEEKQKEQARLDVAKQMHNEKVDLLKNLIDMMKQK